MPDMSVAIGHSRAEPTPIGVVSAHQDNNLDHNGLALIRGYLGRSESSESHGPRVPIAVVNP